MLYLDDKADSFDAQSDVEEMECEETGADGHTQDPKDKTCNDVERACLKPE